MEKFDTETGEVLSEGDVGGEYARSVTAADGNPQPKRSGYISDVIRMLDEGQFNVDASEDMRKLSAALHESAKRNKGRAKGAITLKLDFMIGNGVLVITPSHQTKFPVEKRSGTPLFMAENGSLGLNPVDQMAMFGSRPVRDNYIPGPGEKPREI